MSNTRSPEAMNEHATTVGSTWLREAAVVGRVALDRAGGAGVAARRRVVGRLVDLEAEV